VFLPRALFETVVADIPNDWICTIDINSYNRMIDQEAAQVCLEVPIGLNEKSRRSQRQRALQPSGLISPAATTLSRAGTAGVRVVQIHCGRRRVWMQRRS
jgi:hypothetical protein